MGLTLLPTKESDAKKGGIAAAPFRQFQPYLGPKFLSAEPL